MERINNTGILVTLKTEQVEVFKGQPREYFDEKELELLGQSIIEIGQKNPIHVRELGDGFYELIDGERRLRACVKVGVTHIRAIVHNNVSPEQQHLDSLTFNFFSKGHTHREIFKALSKEVSKGRSVQELMRVLGKSDAWIYSYLSLRKLPPELQELIEHDSRNKCLRYRDAVLLARLDDHETMRSLFAQVRDLHPNKRHVVLKRLVKELKPPQQRRQRKKDTNDYKRSLIAFMDRLSASSETVLDMPKKTFDAIIASASDSEREVWLEEVDECIAKLEILKEALADVCVPEFVN